MCLKIVQESTDRVNELTVPPVSQLLKTQSHPSHRNPPGLAPLSGGQKYRNAPSDHLPYLTSSPTSVGRTCGCHEALPPTWPCKPFKAENVKAMSRVRRAGCAPADFEDGGVTREQAPGNLSEQNEPLATRHGKQTSDSQLGATRFRSPPTWTPP